MTPPANKNCVGAVAACEIFSLTIMSAWPVPGLTRPEGCMMGGSAPVHSVHPVHPVLIKALGAVLLAAVVRLRRGRTPTGCGHPLGSANLDAGGAEQVLHHLSQRPAENRRPEPSEGRRRRRAGRRRSLGKGHSQAAHRARCRPPARRVPTPPALDAVATLSRVRASTARPSRIRTRAGPSRCIA